MSLIGWSWSRTRDCKGGARTYGTKQEAKRNAVFNALKSGGRESATLGRMSAEEIDICWRSLERQGWTLFEVKAEFT